MEFGSSMPLLKLLYDVPKVYNGSSANLGITISSIVWLLLEEAIKFHSKIGYFHVSQFRYENSFCFSYANSKRRFISRIFTFGLTFLRV